MGLKTTPKMTLYDKVNDIFKKLVMEKDTEKKNSYRESYRKELQEFRKDENRGNIPCDRDRSSILLRDTNSQYFKFHDLVKLHLGLAANYEEEEIFDFLLSYADFMEILWGAVVYKQNSGIAVEAVRSGEKEAAGTFITKKEYYLDKLLGRFGLPDEQFYRCVKQPYILNCIVPGCYVPILSGDMEMVQYFEDHGVTWKEDDGMDFGSGRSILNIENKVDYTAGDGWSPICRFPTYLCWIRTEKLQQDKIFEFYDPFTAAILSGCKEMIRYMAEKLGDIPWNACMERVILHSPDEIQEFLLEQFPEIVNHFQLSAIVEAANSNMLELFLLRHAGELEVHWKELKRKLELWNDSETYRFAGGCVITDDAFFGRLLTLTEDREVKDLIVKVILKRAVAFYPNYNEKPTYQVRYQFSGAFSPAYYAPSSRLLQFYFGHKEEGVHDCTELFRAIIEAEKEIKMRKMKKFERFGIDLYNLEERGQSVYTCDDFNNIMRLFTPLEIKDRVDAVNAMMLPKNSRQLVRLSIQNGYIPDKNALALYEYAMDIERIDERILDLLLRLANQRSLQERYEENEKQDL